MRRLRLPIPLLMLSTLPIAVAAQDNPYPTHEEYLEAAEEAGAAPLFDSNEILRLTLRTDIDWLRDTRSDSTEVEGSVIFTDSDGSEVERFVNTRPLAPRSWSTVTASDSPWWARTTSTRMPWPPRSGPSISAAA